MPRYSYICKKCEKKFTVFHAMGETLESCSSCDGRVERIPSMQYTFSSQQKKEENLKSKVDRHIREAKKELEETRKSVGREHE